MRRTPALDDDPASAHWNTRVWKTVPDCARAPKADARAVALCRTSQPGVTCTGGYCERAHRAVEVVTPCAVLRVPHRPGLARAGPSPKCYEWSRRLDGWRALSSAFRPLPLVVQSRSAPTPTRSMLR